MITLAAFMLLAATPAPTPVPTPAPAPHIKVLLQQQEQAPPRGVAESLADVAKRIKLKRTDGGKPLVLTNDTVKELAQGVELTTGVASPDTGPSTESAPTGEASKPYWQGRYQEARADLAYWTGEVTRLEGEAARLENEFYATDDPARRDGEVKPAWDKALADLAAARERQSAAQSKPDQVLNDARRAGALPGWFRGLAEPVPAPSGQQPAEPQSPQQ